MSRTNVLRGLIRAGSRTNSALSAGLRVYRRGNQAAPLTAVPRFQHSINPNRALSTSKEEVEDEKETKDEESQQSSDEDEKKIEKQDTGERLGTGWVLLCERRRERGYLSGYVNKSGCNCTVWL